MKTGAGAEERAIEKLIAQIDSIDQWRERTGRRVLWLFAITFACALSLLLWVAVSQGPPEAPQRPAGPRVPAVLQNFNRR